RLATRAGAVSIAAPGDIGAGEVCRRLPAAFVDQRLEASTVGAGLRAEHTKARSAICFRLTRSLRNQPLAVLGEPGGQRVVRFRLIEGGDSACRGVEQVDQTGEGIPEESGDAKGNVDARPIQYAHRQDLKSGYATRRGIPGGTDAHQRHRLRDVVAAGAHVR